MITHCDAAPATKSAAQLTLVVSGEMGPAATLTEVFTTPLPR